MVVLFAFLRASLLPCPLGHRRHCLEKICFVFLRRLRHTHHSNPLPLLFPHYLLLFPTHNLPLRSLSVHLGLVRSVVGCILLASLFFLVELGFWECGKFHWTGPKHLGG